MKIAAEIQFASSSKDLPSESDIEDWIRETLCEGGRDRAELTVRVVDEEEITSLNSRYRHLNSPTDVLAFPHQLPDEIETDLLGDVVVCAGVVNEQAIKFQVDPQAHWARIIAHGILHLLGFDHDQPHSTLVMETAESAILSRLGLRHPELHGHAS